MPKLKTGDCVLIVLALVACLVAAVWFGGQGLGFWGADGSADDMGLIVVAQSRNGFYRADPLNSDVTYTVEAAGDASAEHGYNTVRIHDGVVEVAEADCSNQICVEHDPISQPGEQIVCLPHGLVVEVVADEEDAAELV